MMSDTWTPSDALVETAARAIYAEAPYITENGMDRSWPNAPGAIRQRCREQARAALSAARDDMVAAERAVIETCVSTLKTLRDDYRNDSEHARLIDAALKAAEGR